MINVKWKDPALKRGTRSPIVAMEQLGWCLRSAFIYIKKKVSANLSFLCCEGLENYH